MKNLVNTIAFISLLIPSVLLGQTVKELPPKAFQEQLSQQKGEAQLVDIRTPKEYKDGHLVTALNINFYDKDFKTQMAQLKKEESIYVYCAAGGRSGKASKKLKEMGFKTVYDLDGGYNKWNKAGLKTSK